MNLDDISDSELFSLICEENEDACDLLYQKYKYLIASVVQKYLEVTSFEYDDLNQEALLGFYDAISDYKDDKKTSLSTFISLCVERRLRKLIRNSGRIKSRISLETLSLEHVYEQYDVPLRDLVSDENSLDPLNNITKNEDYKQKIEVIKKRLSKNEKEVFKLLIQGVKCGEIAEKLNLNFKQLDNTMTRIKTKIKSCIKFS